MWMVFRKGRRARWIGQDATIVTAALDLMPRPVDHGDLSVFDVEDQGTATKVAVLKGLTERDHPDDVDYVLVSPAAFAAIHLTLAADNPIDLHPFLSARHRLVAIAGKEVAETLASEALQRGATVERIRESQMITLASSLLAQDASLAAWVRSSAWRTALGLAI